MTRYRDIREISLLLNDTIQKGQKAESMISMPLNELIKEHKRIVKVLASGTDAEKKAELQAQKKELESYIKRKQRTDMRKSLSFNPLEPHTMNAESAYYNPYQQLGDGSFIPHSSKYWMEMAPNVTGVDAELRRDGYTEVDRFYAMAGVKKSELYKAVDDIVKAIPGSPSGKNNVPVGTVHQWHGLPFKKVGPGQWVPVSQGKGPHPIEQDHQKRLSRIQSELEARKQGLKKEPSFDDRARNANQKHSELSKKEAELADREQKLKTADLDKREQDLTSKEKNIEETSKHFEKVSKELPLKHQLCGPECKEELSSKVRRAPKGQGKHVDLNKAELAELLKSGKYALISAGRNHADPEDSKLSDDEVNKRYSQLESDLKTDGFNYTRIKGKYGGEEDSFLVMVHDAEMDHVTDLGKKYKQDSVIYSHGGKHQMIYTTGQKAGKGHDGEGFEEKPEAEDYYSEISHPDGSKTKFSLAFDFDRERTVESPFEKKPDQKKNDKIESKPS